MNRIRLSARLVGRAAVRYTPAGVPVVEAQVRHSGSVLEAGSERQLDFEIRAVAVGSVAHTLAAIPLGSALEIDGFIAPVSRRGRQLIVHITEHRSITGD